MHEQVAQCVQSEYLPPGGEMGVNFPYRLSRAKEQYWVVLCRSGGRVWLQSGPEAGREETVARASGVT